MYKVLHRRLALFLALVAPVSASADVLIVDGAGGGDFTVLQEAVEAAQTGDTIEISSGTYAGFDASGKALVVRASDGAQVLILGSSTIEDVPAGKVFVLQELEMEGVFDTSLPRAVGHGHALECLASLGAVRLEDVTAFGQVGFDAVIADTLDSLTLVGVQGRGDRNLGDGGASRALLSGGVSLAMFGTQLTGADGNFIFDTGGEGARHLGGYVFLAETTLRGGQGDHGISQLSAPHCIGPGEGGDGFINLGDAPWIRGAMLRGGPPGDCVCNCPGYYYGAGFGYSGPTPQQLPAGFVRNELNAAGTAGATVPVVCKGEVGDAVYAVVSREYEFGFKDFGAGIDPKVPLFVRSGSFQSAPEWQFLGTMGASATLSASIVNPYDPAGLSSYPLYYQTVHVSSGSGEVRPGPVRTVTIQAQTSGTMICLGDGADPVGCNDCPCGNTAPVGSRGGCLNSTGSPARLRAFGSPSLSNETLRFDLTGAPAMVASRLASADNALPLLGPCSPGSGISTGSGLDGMRCIGGNLVRHGVRNTNEEGRTFNPWGPPSATPPQGFAVQGGFAAGQTRHFQAFYREDPSFACGLGQNTSNGVTIVFVP